MVSILLGMSLPTTVVYVTLAVLVGPALAQLGIVPLAAHLFLFYFGMLSLITPPDCLATYAAAAIAKADFWKTGWTGMRLGIVAYIVPFVFVYHPALILEGSVLEIVATVLTASVGVGLLGIACAGYLFRPLGWLRRGWAIGAAMLLILPPQTLVPLAVLDVAGFGLGLALVLSERLAGAAQTVAAATTEGPVKIDVFPHILPRKYFDRMLEVAPARPAHAEAHHRDPGARRREICRFRIMDRYPDYVQVLTLAAPPIEVVAGPERSPELARLANDEMAALVARHPDRFPAFVASLPMNNPDAALGEIDRALDQLGATGVQVFTNVNGRPARSARASADLRASGPAAPAGVDSSGPPGPRWRTIPTSPARNTTSGGPSAGRTRRPSPWGGSSSLGSSTVIPTSSSSRTTWGPWSPSARDVSAAGSTSSARAPTIPTMPRRSNV